MRINRRDEDRRARLLAERKAKIAVRLIRVCDDLAPREFDALIERMAVIEIKYSVRRTDDFFEGDLGSVPPGSSEFCLSSQWSHDAVTSFDRAGTAERLRSLFGKHDDSSFETTAERLGVSELSLRMSVDEESPHPTVEVMAAAIEYYGVDPAWLVTGRYDPASHRSSLKTGEHSAADSLREVFARSDIRPGGSPPKSGAPDSRA
jgi:hypothetical protein